ncbi:MAG: DUF1287 domain-containing protein [Chitinispirillales bacterium]|jgi:uncharacterized protein YijF (DUF1287 family)|nr:DUF1287 domain-containing protein [Chitinispirillales bacterium]
MITTKKFALLTLTTLFALTAPMAFGQNARLAAAASEVVDADIVYDPAYVKIPYPNGDVDPRTGVCTDVVIRAYRKIGIDLQKLVHEDMRANFDKYPQNWGRRGPDANIDHRRVPNLMKFFSRHGDALKITGNPSDYKPGDIVCWNLSGGIVHIGIIADRMPEEEAKKPDGRHLIVHNIGGGQVYADRLFEWKIIGHYSYPKNAAQKP